VLELLAGCGGENDDRSGPPTGKSSLSHLVIIYQENKSFDSYFGIYPVAANPAGEPAFAARPTTPVINGFTTALLDHNPNETNPFRIGRAQSLTCDQSHDYGNEQKAWNGDRMDQFVLYGGLPQFNPRQFCTQNAAGHWDTVMGFFDGNAVTALWNYAQHFSMSDNAFATNPGPSTPGALNLVAGDTFGVVCAPANDVYGAVPTCGGPASSTSQMPPSGSNSATLIGDADPYWDVCSSGSTAAFSGRNVGDLLNQAGITWGWFQGGFTPNSAGKCASRHALDSFDRAVGIDPRTDTLRIADYVPHHNPFQYFASTANPQHLAPTSTSMVGKTDQANHQYDLSSFWAAADAGNVPTVSFLKAAAYQNGHPANSTPLDEQQFLVETLNRLQMLPQWDRMAVIIAWDDSDGWYDHLRPPIVNRSNTPLDYLCGDATDGPGARCGYGPRLPFVVISPFAKQNYVSSVRIDQSSVLRFIEDRWLNAQRVRDTSFDRIAGSLEDLFDFDGRPAPRLLLDPSTGTEQ
jgi:phospholipase C